MLIYLIPFLVLLVVAVVLKQREGKSAAEESETPKNKNKAKASPEPKGSKSKLGSKSRKPKSDSQSVERSDTPSTPQIKSTAVAPDLLQKLQQLIHGGHYSTAEAHINQALNRDPSQHELYLILLKVHALQKDDLAINQLINHIRSLNMPELLAEAEAKRNEHEHLQSIENDFLLENEQATTQPSKANPFAHLQFQSANTAQQTDNGSSPSAKFAADDAAELNFSDFNFAAPTQSSEVSKANTTATDDAFSGLSGFGTALNTDTATNTVDLSANFTANDTTQIIATENNTQQATSATSDFNFSFEANNTTAETAPLNLTPNQAIDSSATAALTAETQSTSLDFNFSTPEDALSIAPAQTTPSDLNSLSFADTSNVASDHAAAASPRDQTMDFDLSNFSFGLETQVSKVTQATPQPDPAETTPNLNTQAEVEAATFSFQLADARQATPSVAQEAVVQPETALTFDLSAPPSAELSTRLSPEPAPQDEATQSNTAALNGVSQIESENVSTSTDMLLQQFPELRKLNATQLDMDLAELYADYAAPQAAEALLHDVAGKSLSHDQKQHLEQLQQRIKPSNT